MNVISLDTVVRFGARLKLNESSFGSLFLILVQDYNATSRVEPRNKMSVYGVLIPNLRFKSFLKAPF